MVGLECVLLMAPAIICIILLHKVSARLARTLAVTWALICSAVYLADLTLYLNIREHLLSPIAYRLGKSILPFLWSYLPAKDIAWGFGVLALWITAQVLLWFIAGRLGRRTQRSDSRIKEVNWRTALIAAACVIGMLAWFVSPIITETELTLREIRKRSDRHPITATGWIRANLTPELRPDSYAAIRGSAQLLAKHADVESLVKEYRTITASPRDEDDHSQTLPDIVIVVTESLRPEAINAKTSPNLFAHSRQGVNLNNHVSAGNFSYLGFFGLMTGIDPAWIHHADRLPVGMFDCLKQVGYETGFFGRDDFNKFGMEAYCAPNRFDFSEFVQTEDSNACDEEVCRLAAKFFDRDPPYATMPAKAPDRASDDRASDDRASDDRASDDRASDDRASVGHAPDGHVSDGRPPRVALVYMYSSHYPYFSDDVDQIHGADDLSGFREDVRQRSGSTLIEYLNSVHFVDRTLAPLMDASRITFITGDHGESFGEDKRLMHGSAMSRVQLQVACFGFGPGMNPRQINEVTSHVDIMPTVLDAVGIELENSSLISGTSLLGPIDPEQVVASFSQGADAAFFRRGQTLQYEDRNSTSHKRIADNGLIGSGFAYKGFVGMTRFILSPGGMIDRFGSTLETDLPTDESSDASWKEADTMRRWLAQLFGEDFANIPEDPSPLIREAMQSTQPSVRLHAIGLCTRMGERCAEFLPELERLLEDPNEHVKSAAFQAVHRIHR